MPGSSLRGYIRRRHEVFARNSKQGVGLIAHHSAVSAPRASPQALAVVLSLKLASHDVQPPEESHVEQLGGQVEHVVLVPPALKVRARQTSEEWGQRARWRCEARTG